MPVDIVGFRVQIRESKGQTYRRLTPKHAIDENQNGVKN